MLIRIDDLHLDYGTQTIFKGLQLVIHDQDRVCIVGRNGTGKSTLLKCLVGRAQPDSGEIQIREGAKIAYLDQELPPASEETVRSYILTGVADTVNNVEKYNELALKSDEESLNAMQGLLDKIEADDGWNLATRVDQVLDRLGLDGSAQLSSLSGGWRRRADLGRALVTKPDVLLLDEPTNHLDVGAIDWLGNFLAEFNGALVFITHDRAFLRRVATSIAELDRGKLHLYQEDYETYLVKKEERLEIEEKHNALFDKRLADEEAWIRKGIKARRTRNEGRVRALKAMRLERSQRLEKQGKANIAHTSDVASGKMVAELTNVNFGFANKPLIKQFSSLVIRGDKIGLIGPNGVGKTTLLKLILGDLEPDSGSIRHGTKRSVAYFDQTRNVLDEDKSALDNIGEGRDFVEIKGKSRHVISYLEDFLFSGERARTPIRTLSGGERNRILLAKLFSKPFNVLVLDEPTNDLDVETLELLESMLVEYEGTLLLVSHDREFINNVVTSTAVFYGDGRIEEFPGGYDDWLRQGGSWDQLNDPEMNTPGTAAKVSSVTAAKSGTKKSSEEKKVAPVKKLSYNEQKELARLPDKIEKKEEQVASLEEAMAGTGFYSRPQSEIDQHMKKLNDAQQELEDLYERWTELSD